MASGHADRVFPTDPKKAWHNALRRAKFVNFRLHDLRHTAASYMVMAGATLISVSGVL